MLYQWGIAHNFFILTISFQVDPSKRPKADSWWFSMFNKCSVEAMIQMISLRCHLIREKEKWEKLIIISLGWIWTDGDDLRYQLHRLACLHMWSKSNWWPKRVFFVWFMQYLQSNKSSLLNQLDSFTCHIRLQIHFTWFDQWERKVYH